MMEATQQNAKLFLRSSFAMSGISWRKVGFLAAGLLIVAVTTAASSDWHSDLGFHKDCVLCQLAQLALILPPEGFGLPPLTLIACEIPAVWIIGVDSLRVRSNLTRGPPASIPL
jgi:hypothetical protein